MAKGTLQLFPIQEACGSNPDISKSTILKEKYTNCSIKNTGSTAVHTDTSLAINFI